MEKKKIGVVVAIELEAIFDVYPNIQELQTKSNYKVYSVEKNNAVLYIVRSGMGECAASAATQFLITKYDVSLIVNFGVVGGLTNSMKTMKVCLVNQVVHYKYDCSEFMPLKVGQVDGYDSIFIKTNEEYAQKILSIMPDLSTVTCCSGDKFISTKEEKKYLNDTFMGDICDMESSGIVLTCDINNVPCVLLKAVSDGLSDGADGFYKELFNASKKCFLIVNQLIESL